MERDFADGAPESLREDCPVCKGVKVFWLRGVCFHPILIASGQGSFKPRLSHGRLCAEVQREKDGEVVGKPVSGPRVPPAGEAAVVEKKRKPQSGETPAAVAETLRVEESGG
jgi:hypothetical protein